MAADLAREASVGQAGPVQAGLEDGDLLRSFLADPTTTGRREPKAMHAGTSVPVRSAPG